VTIPLTPTLSPAGAGAREFHNLHGLRQFPQRQLALGTHQQRSGFAAPLRDVAAQRLAFVCVAAVPVAIAIAKRRSQPWVPDILRPQHLES
jgi:hypothetical protein